MPLPPHRVDYLPMIDRPVIKWPDNARVAFWVAPNIEHYEYLPVLDGVRNPWPRSPLPDVQQYSLHEYGNRVGFWRVLEVLDRYQIRCSTTLNIGVLQHFPEIADAMLKRDRTAGTPTSASELDVVATYAPAVAGSGARPPVTISTSVRSACATSSSESGNRPSTHPVSSSSTAPKKT